MIHDMLVDLNSGLTWFNVAPKGQFNFDEARELAQHAKDFRGEGGYRVPSVEELLTLVNYGKADPATELCTFAIQSDRYWTSESEVRFPHLGWWVSFSNGKVGTGAKDRHHPVLLVRGGLNQRRPLDPSAGDLVGAWVRKYNSKCRELTAARDGAEVQLREISRLRNNLVEVSNRECQLRDDDKRAAALQINNLRGELQLVRQDLLSAQADSHKLYKTVMNMRATLQSLISANSELVQKNNQTLLQEMDACLDTLRPAKPWEKNGR